MQPLAPRRQRQTPCTRGNVRSRRPPGRTKRANLRKKMASNPTSGSSCSSRVRHTGRTHAKGAREGTAGTASGARPSPCRARGRQGGKASSSVRCNCACLLPALLQAPRDARGENTLSQLSGGDTQQLRDEQRESRSKRRRAQRRQYRSKASGAGSNRRRRRCRHGGGGRRHRALRAGGRQASGEPRFDVCHTPRIVRVAPGHGRYGMTVMGVPPSLQLLLQQAAIPSSGVSAGMQQTPQEQADGEATPCQQRRGASTAKAPGLRIVEG